MDHYEIVSDPRKPGSPHLFGQAAYLDLLLQKGPVFGPGEVKILKTGISAFNTGPALICLAQRQDRPRVGPIRIPFTILTEQSSHVDITIPIKNTSDKQVSASSPENSICLLLFSVPLTYVSINCGYITRSQRTKSKIPVSTAFRVNVRSTAIGHNMTLTMKRTKWSPQKPATSTGTHIAMVSVETTGILTLRKKDTAILQTASDPGVRLDHTIYSDGKLIFCLTYIPGKGTSTTPPLSMQLNLHLYRSGSTVVMKKNPDPLLKRFPGNGFVVIAPTTFNLKTGKEATIFINNAFRCKEDSSHVCMFFPITNPNLDCQMMMWPEGESLSVILRATGDIRIQKGSVLGRLHFFLNDPSVLALVPTARNTWQWSTTAVRGRNDDINDDDDDDYDDNNDYNNATDSSDTDLDDLEEEVENASRPPNEDFSNLSLNAVDRSPLREVPPQRSQADEERFQRELNRNDDSDQEDRGSNNADFLLLVEKTYNVDRHAMVNIGTGVLPLCVICFEKMHFAIHNRSLLRHVLFPIAGVNCCETAPLPIRGRYSSPTSTQSLKPSNDYPPFSSEIDV